ncbi:MAG: hypothetical protein A3J37_06175 [Alphaproteobacteria bacterium RIFCSPHIGHO2_12_FULL_45_9]|nr:MAG: hypothetical protein A3B66_05580 [Alphaproteobacteria bacterium RIFCSPHIGHO2_02_FULL_46_13]OFW94593.1 MAG: hypothetical protein A3J37_06175 [Alphaproteobacteria bacterium RIFCSPHIGHO2_12_FULL_45_9]
MSKQKSAQEYLIKAKLYRFMSLVFVTLGIFVFCALYIQNVEGKLVEALKNPMTIAIFLVPFFPAAVLSFLADSAEKKYKKMTEGNSQKK